MTDSTTPRDIPIAIEAIGHVSSPRVEPLDDDWGAIVATISLTPARFAPAALAGLEDFSHVEVIYVFDQVDPGSVHTGARRPRGNPDWPQVGVFAQRAKGRPNRIGVSVCELVAIAGLTLTVRGLDAIDATPVIDLKPYMSEFSPRGEIRQPQWSHELMAEYWSRPARPGEQAQSRASLGASAATAAGRKLAG